MLLLSTFFWCIKEASQTRKTALNQINLNFVDDEKGLKTNLSFAYQIRFGYLSFLCF